MESRERTLCRINKETRIMGVSVMNLVVLVGCALMPGIASKYSLFITFPIIIWIIRKMKSAENQGCPDYISEQLKKIHVKDQYSDTDHLMEKIIDND